jgi:hypothetical protein
MGERPYLRLRNPVSAARAGRLRLGLLAGPVPGAGVPGGSAMKPGYSGARAESEVQAGAMPAYSAVQVYCPSAVSVVCCRAYPASPAGSMAVLHQVADYYQVVDYYRVADLADY